jgi:hypothetical protein
VTWPAAWRPLSVLELLVSSQPGGGPAHAADLLAGLDPRAAASLREEP